MENKQEQEAFNIERKLRNMENPSTIEPGVAANESTLPKSIALCNQIERKLSEKIGGRLQEIHARLGIILLSVPVVESPNEDASDPPMSELLSRLSTLLAGTNTIIKALDHTIESIDI